MNKATLSAIAFGLLLIFASSSVLCDTPFKAYVDRNEISQGQSLRLTIEYNGDTEENPDLAPLEEHFTILSRQKGQQSTFMNGDFKQTTSWILDLLPIKQGPVTIPAITMGSYSTAPIEITQSKGSSHGNVPEGVTLKVTTDRDRVYVNAQLILNIEIKTDLPLQNGTFNQPDIEDAIVEPLVDDGQSDVIENGMKVRVFRRSYAVFPSKAGELKIPAIAFEGITIGKRERGGWPGFFSTGSRVNARSDEIRIKVMDVPKSYPKGQPFLPMKNLVVIESMDEKARFEVNQATARRFEVKADGTLTTFLPVIKEPVTEDLQVYSEGSSKKQTPDENGIESSSKVTHVYMPTSSGKMVIPAQTIYWWDTEQDKLRTAMIRELSIDVTGVKAKSSDKKNIVPPEKELEPKPKLEPERGDVLKWALPALLLLSILIVLGTWLRKKTGAIPEGSSKKEALKRMIKEIASSCDRGDERLCYRQLRDLLAWQEQHQLVTVSDELIQKLGELECQLYRRDGFRSKDDPALLGQIKKIVLNIKIKKVSPLKLPSIYPI